MKIFRKKRTNLRDWFQDKLKPAIGLDLSAPTPETFTGFDFSVEEGLRFARRYAKELKKQADHETEN